MLRTIPQSPGAYRIRRLSRAAAVARRSDATKKQKEKYNALLHEMSNDLDRLERVEVQASVLDGLCKAGGDLWYNTPLELREAVVHLLRSLDPDRR
jgi:hypothetical protein